MCPKLGHTILVRNSLDHGGDTFIQTSTNICLIRKNFTFSRVGKNWIVLKTTIPITLYYFFLGKDGTTPEGHSVRPLSIQPFIISTKRYK